MNIIVNRRIRMILPPTIVEASSDSRTYSTMATLNEMNDGAMDWVDFILLNSICIYIIKQARKHPTFKPFPNSKSFRCCTYFKIVD